MLPAAAVRDRSLGQCTPLHVLAWLCKYRNTKTGECYPAVETMARDLGISARAVQRHMKALIDCGHLVVVERRNRATGRQTSNLYYVLYRDVLATPDRDAAPEPAEGSGEPLKSSGGPLMASDAGVTHGVIPQPSGVTHGVANTSETRPGGVTHDVGGGVTHDVAPGDTMCHPNYPTCSIPLNEPSAEAARLRALEAAAADERARKISEGKPNTETATVDLSPRLASHLRVLSRTTGKPEAAFVTVVTEWRDRLIDCGLDAGLALDRIMSEARRIPATGYSWEALAEAMAKDLSRFQPETTALLSR